MVTSPMLDDEDFMLLDDDGQVPYRKPVVDRSPAEFTRFGNRQDSLRYCQILNYADSIGLTDQFLNMLMGQIRLRNECELGGFRLLATGAVLPPLEPGETRKADELVSLLFIKSIERWCIYRTSGSELIESSAIQNDETAIGFFVGKFAEQALCLKILHKDARASM